MKYINKQTNPMLVFSLLLWNQFSSVVVAPFCIEILFKNESVLSDLFAQLISVSMPVFLLLAVTSQSKRIDFELKNRTKTKANKKAILISIIAIFLLFITVWYLINFLQCVYVICSHYNPFIIEEEYNYNTISIIVAILAYIILPSVSEELLFRGMISDAFPTIKNKCLIICSSILFAVAHGKIISIISAFVLGCYLMIVYTESHSIKLIIILHMIYNSLCCFFANNIELPYAISAVAYGVNSGTYYQKACLASAILFLTFAIVFYLCTQKYIFTILREESSREILLDSNITEIVWIIVTLLESVLFRGIMLII